MHIAHVGTRYEAETLHGPTRAFSAYANYLVDLGHKITLVQFAHDGLRAGVQTGGDFPTVILKDRAYARRLGPETTDLLRNNVLQADVYHFHSSFVGHALAAHLLSVPYVVSTHGAYTPSDMNRRRLHNLAFKWAIGRRYLQEASVVHAITPFEQEANIRYAGRINARVIPNAIQPDVSFNQEARVAMRAQLTADKDELLLLYLGRLDVIGKGLDLLVEGFRRAQHVSKRPIRLVLAGPPWRGDLRKLIGQDLTGRVTVLPPVMGEEKRALLSAADAFATLSRWDVMPTAVLDALGTGLSILVTEATGFGDFVRTSGNGAVVATSEDVADAILDLDHSTLLAGRDARIAAALAAFHPRQIAEAFVGIYTTALDS
jgi:glycosyltransferase involved in cell wall biosynthesis